MRRSSCCCAQESGYSLTDDELNRAFIRFKGLADKKKEITSLDLASIVNDEIRDVNIRRYELVGMQVRGTRIDLLPIFSKYFFSCFWWW